MYRNFLAIFAFALAAHAQLTTAQKAADFRNLADFFAKNYGLTEWKRAALGRNPFDLRPWLERVNATSNDIEFFEIMAEWVASLEDGHSYYSAPSTFVARLPFTVDIYDGKVIVDSIDRARAPEESFPVQVGDELLSIDGVTTDELMASFRKLVGEGNLGALRRSTAGMITVRRQSIIPRAPAVPDSSQIAFRAASGESSTHTVAWAKSGIPFASIPGSPEILAAKPSAAVARSAASGDPFARLAARQFSAVSEDRAVLGFGSKTPVFSLEFEGFEQRLGKLASERIVSGIFTAGEKKIGYIRFPSFSDTTALTQTQNEIRALHEMTDALIFDVMRNGGGVACRAETLMSALTPRTYQGFRLARRVTWAEYLDWKEIVSLFEEAGIGGASLDLAREQLAGLEVAITEGRLLTEPVGLCAAGRDRGPALDRLTGESVAYSKPVVLLVDSYSFSAAELLPSLFQDAARGPVIGVRTGGAGGTVLSGVAGVYSEGSVSYTSSLGIRNREVSTEGLPTGPYIENHGVHPDIVIDYMTLENLREKGKPFLTQVLEKTLEHLAAQ